MQWVTAPAIATGIYEMPSLTSETWIVDKADVLSRLNEGKISSELQELAQKTGTEVRFVTIHRLDYGETIDSFARQLFKKWFPTPEAQANQVLLVLDNVTNTTAIQTGEQVKSTLADAIAESVAQETMMMPIRTGNKYNEAFIGASERLIAVLSGNPDPGPPQVEDSVRTEGTFATAEETEETRGSSTVWVIGLLVAATVIPMATYYLYIFLQSQA